MNTKVILVIADGIGDRLCEELGEKTPLEYAKTPALDSLAAEAETGIMDVYRPGITVGSDVGHLLLLGYDVSDYPERGPIEALGIGMDLQPGDVAMRCDFATVDQDMTVLDRRAGRIHEGGEILAEALNGITIGDTQILCSKSTGHRIVITLRGEGLSCHISDADPKRDGLRIKTVVPTDGTAEAARTAHVMNQLMQKAHEILENHPVNEERRAAGLPPANAVLARGAGFLAALPTMTEKTGLRTACITGTSAVIGIARLAGMDVITKAGFTGMMGTDIAGKAKEAARALDDYDFVLLHYKATDQMGHDGDPAGKVRAIEAFDQMIGYLLKELEDRSHNRPEREMEEVILAVTADHSTPCEHRDHSGDPVPVMIRSRSIRRDRVTAFGERSCAGGGIGRIRGRDLYTTLMGYLGVDKKLGN